MYEQKKDALEKKQNALYRDLKSGKKTFPLYCDELKNTLAKNQELHNKLIRKKEPEDQIIRVWERIVLLKDEVAKLEAANPKQANSRPVSITNKTSPNAQLIPNDKQTKTGSNGIKPHNKAPNSEIKAQNLNINQNSIELVSEKSIDPVANLLMTKIQIRKSFMEYLHNNYGEKRIQDFVKIDEEVKKMEKAITIVREHPGKLTFEKIDAIFPDLTQIQILGETRQSIEKKMLDIIERIKQETKEIKNKKASELVLAHYKQFFAKLNQISKEWQLNNQKRLLVQASARQINVIYL